MALAANSAGPAHNAGAAAAGLSMTLSVADQQGVQTLVLADAQAPIGKDTRALLSADFNRDCLVDLVQATTTDGEVLLYLNSGSATPYDGVTSQVLGRSTLGDSLSGFAPNSLAAGDVDNDGDPDLLVGDKSGRPPVGSGALAGPPCPLVAAAVGAARRAAAAGAGVCASETAA